MRLHTTRIRAQWWGCLGRIVREGCSGLQAWDTSSKATNRWKATASRQCWGRKPFTMLETILLQLNWRRNWWTHYLASKYLVPTKVPSLNTAAVADVYRHYGDDLVDVQSLQQLGVEVNRCRTTWRDIDGTPRDLVTTLDACKPQFFPGIYRALNTFLTYPVSVRTAEGSFSVLKHVKTPLLHNTMTGQRLSSVVFLHIHKDIEIDTDEVVNQFGGANQRRLQLLFD